jgi:hypothetical protein
VAAKDFLLRLSENKFEKDIVRSTEEQQIVKL